MKIQKPKNYKSHFTVYESGKILLIISFTDTNFQSHTELCESYKDVVVTDDDEFVYITID